jgi:hypothetical protein
MGYGYDLLKPYSSLTSRLGHVLRQFPPVLSSHESRRYCPYARYWMLDTRTRTGCLWNLLEDETVQQNVIRNTLPKARGAAKPSWRHNALRG